MPNVPFRSGPLVAIACIGLLAAGAAPPPARQPGLRPAASAVRAGVRALPPQQALDDATIVAIFDAANTADIETASLAADHAASKDVKALGRMFARDHRQVRQQGRDLAKKLGVTPTPPREDPSAAQHAAAMRLLQSRHGADFDTTFLDHEIAYHKAVIAAITTTLLPAIKNPELKQLVTTVAPAFQAHLDAAEALRRKLTP